MPSLDCWCNSIPLRSISNPSTMFSFVSSEEEAAAYGRGAGSNLESYPSDKLSRDSAMSFMSTSSTVSSEGSCLMLTEENCSSWTLLLGTSAETVAAFFSSGVLARVGLFGGFAEGFAKSTAWKVVSSLAAFEVEDELALGEGSSSSSSLTVIVSGSLLGSKGLLESSEERDAGDA